MYTDDGTEIQSHGCMDLLHKSFRFKGGLLNRMVNKSSNFLHTKIHDLMLNCLPFVTYMVTLAQRGGREAATHLVQVQYVLVSKHP